MSIAADTKLGRYEIRSKIGEGGMGQVYLAEDATLKRRVAIKLLPPASIGDEQANKRLLREARAAATLDHPNICSIHEVGDEGNQTFIVMQYVEGETLDAIIKRKTLDLSDVLNIAAQVADALAEAHAHGIIHRDIKPANVFIGNDGGLILGDFGIAFLPNLPERVTLLNESVEAGLAAGMRVVGVSTTHPDLRGISLLIPDFTDPALEAWLGGQA